MACATRASFARSADSPCQSFRRIRDASSSVFPAAWGSTSRRWPPGAADRRGPERRERLRDEAGRHRRGDEADDDDRPGQERAARVPAAGSGRRGGPSGSRARPRGDALVRDDDARPVGWMRRSARSTMRGSWLENRNATPRARWSSSNTSRSFFAVSESSEAVGSSARMRTGSPTTARATATALALPCPKGRPDAGPRAPRGRPPQGRRARARRRPRRAARESRARGRRSPPQRAPARAGAPGRRSRSSPAGGASGRARRARRRPARRRRESPSPAGPAGRAGSEASSCRFPRAPREPRTRRPGARGTRRTRRRRAPRRGDRPS